MIRAKCRPVPATHSADTALVRAVAAGDKAALKVLYLRHRDRVYRFVLRLTGQEATADEIVNEVFLEVWRHAERFNGKSQVATWLLAMARFKAISQYRRHSEGPLDQDALALIADPSDGPVASIEKRERSDIVQKCLKKLTPIQREAINLIYYQGKKIEEVAQSTGTPVSTVKTRLHYARSRMAELLTAAGVDRAWVAG